MLPSGPRSPPAPATLRAGLATECAVWRKPRVWLAAVAILLAPSLYVLIYVSSVWDPYGEMSQLPAALVNLDVPVTHAGHHVALGLQIVTLLEQERPFAFVRFPTPEAARAAVRAGTVFFALIIPSDFSRSATDNGRRAQLGLYVSEGGNYTASIFSRRFGAELAHLINEKLGTEQWAALIGGPGPSSETTLQGGLRAMQIGGRQLAEGAGQVHAGTLQLGGGLGGAREGAKKLADGSGQVADGSSRLTAGMKEVEAAVASIRAKLPPDSKLEELARGSHDLAQGAAGLKQGLTLLEGGVPQLDAGAGELQAGAAKVPFVGGKLSAGTGRLRAGIETFGAGLARASLGAAQLSDGMNQLDPALQPLAAGVVELNAGLAELVGKLPAAEQLELLDHSMGQIREGSTVLLSGLDQLQTGAAQLQAGSLQVEEGARRLADGLDETTARFEAGFGGADAGKLATPVELQVETTAPVPANGPAFAPYFSALSLWVGALMLSFVFHLRRLPETMRRASRPAKWLAKVAALLILGVLQASVVFAVLVGALGVPLAHPIQVWLAAVLGALAFVNVVIFFMVVLGDAGRLLAVILLILQLAASGGIYPVELSSSFYQSVHGYLPFTFLVRAFRATMFSAFDGRWGGSAAGLAGFAAAAMLGSVLLARWKYVPEENYGPAVEF